MLPFDSDKLGSGAVWRSPRDPNVWVINYSGSCRNSTGSSCSGQQIRFQTAASPRGPWQPRRDVPPFVPNESLGYSGFRWDTINPYWDEHTQTLFGWWTAGLQTDGPGPCPGQPHCRWLQRAGRSAMGFGSSSDGVHWVALPPAILTWPPSTNVTAAGFEIGGVAPLLTRNGTRRWFASVCMSHQELPAAIDGKVGCFSFVADFPGGPYTIVAQNAAIMGYRQSGHDPEYAYYHRFFHGPNGVLLTNYQVYDKAHWKREIGVTVYMSALKQLTLGPDDDVLRMMWWPDHERLKVPPGRPVHEAVWRINADAGSIVEGRVIWGSSGGVCFPYSHDQNNRRPNNTGIFAAGYVKFNASHVLTGEATTADCGAGSTVVNDTLGVTTTAPEPSRALALTTGAEIHFRLMFRRGMYDIYVEDALILSYALAVGGKPYAVQQELRLVGSWASASNVHSWGMSLV
jgi:hypothetical protein